MKLKPNFITHTIGEDQMLLDVSGGKDRFSGMVRSNKTAAFLIDCLKTETTPEQMVSSLLETYDTDRETAVRTVDYVLEKLRQVGALEE